MMAMHPPRLWHPQANHREICRRKILETPRPFWLARRRLIDVRDPRLKVR